MVIYFREESRLMIALPRLLARLPENSPEKRDFEQLHQRLKIGLLGERKVDRFLESLRLPSSIKILKNVELSLGEGQLFQIDTLIVSQKYLLLLEIKNIAGDLYFETNPNQLVRMLGGEKTKMDCPIIQLANTEAFFQRWLAQRNFPTETFGQVILANQKSFVRLAPPNTPVSFMKRLPAILQEKDHQTEIMSHSQLNKLVNAIKQEQTEYNPYPLCDYFQINPNILKTGQLCPDCNISLHHINHKRRMCLKCNAKVPSDYKTSLQDWFMLVSNSITNQQCRNFLELRTRYNAQYALNSISLNKVGRSVATKYLWPANKPFKTLNNNGG